MPGGQPTLLNSCAMAATAAEARFRIDAPDPPPRASRIVALDRGAADVILRVAGEFPGASHFLTYRPGSLIASGDGDIPDVTLHTADGGTPLGFGQETSGADMVVMVATADDGAAAAAAIGEACYRRGIMTGAVVFGDDADVRRAVSALRPHAQVLLVTQDEDDVAAVLTALRA